MEWIYIKMINISVLAVFLCLTVVCGLERDMTISIDPGRSDCFFHHVKEGQILDIEYQVIDGSHGDLDISFQLYEPGGRLMYADYKKSENGHRFDTKVTGDYKLCFDNTFSSFNSKTVFFEIVIEGDEEDDELNNLDHLTTEELYDMKIQDIQDALGRIKTRLSKVRHLQELFRLFEARDRNNAEENYFKVNTWSACQIVVMVLVGFIQVVMVKSLFDHTYKAHKVWEKLGS